MVERIWERFISLVVHRQRHRSARCPRRSWFLAHVVASRTLPALRGAAATGFIP